MNLREPKKKRGKLKEQLPFPIALGDGQEWITYTAHLTDLGSCVTQLSEIAAIHSMGFFGKGSLSRSYPSFGKPRYGAPPIVRNRQWVRREEWLRQVNEINIECNGSQDFNLGVGCKESFDESSADTEPCQVVKHESSNPRATRQNNEPSLQIQEVEGAPDIIEIHSSLTRSSENLETDVTIEKQTDADPLILDPTEEDDVCVIVNKDANEQLDNNDEEDDEQELFKNEERRFPYEFDNYSFKDNVNFPNDDTGLDDKLLVLPDSDSDTENYLKEIKPKIECEGFPVLEALHLTFEETFFLLYGLGCLNVVNFDGTLLDIDSTWKYFCKVDKDFVQKYVVYHYFRSKGWVVKPGIKYGGDFLLYKQGPAFYHASYVVVVDVVDADTLIREPTKSTRNFTWNHLLGLERLSETAAKEILYAQVMWPSTVSKSSTPNVDALSEFSVRELLWRRWNPKHKNDAIDLEDDDDDDDSC